MTGLNELLSAIQKQGYTIDQKESKNNRTLTLRNSKGGKVIARLGDTGKAIWLDCRSGKHGDYYDWTGERYQPRAGLTTIVGATAPQTSFFSQPASFSVLNERHDSAVKKATRVYESGKDSVSDYLIHRGIDVSVQNSSLFKTELRQSKNAVLFFHRDINGAYCGYEIRNTELKAFGKDCVKGLFISQNRDCDSILLCESAIEALSAYAIMGDRYRYASVAGALGRYQLAMIERANNRYRIVCGFNNDDAGEQYEKIIMDRLGYLIKENPSSCYKDWNQQLCNVTRNSF